MKRYGHVLIRQAPEIDPIVWSRLTDDFQRLVAAKPRATSTGDGRYQSRFLFLADDTGARDTAPYVDTDVIAFNGECGWGHLSGDPMLVERVSRAGETWVCLTDHKPYDLYVCALLLLLSVHAPASFEIASDGSWPEWDDAIRFVSRVLGYHVTPSWL